MAFENTTIEMLGGRRQSRFVEHEVLRMVANLGGRDVSASADEARRCVLAWAQNRAPGRLPPEAWNFDSFEHLAGGRTSVGVRIQTEGADLWGIRTDDPDRGVPGRVWTTEVVIGRAETGPAKVSCRQIVSWTGSSPPFTPHSPGLVQQLAETCGLEVGNYQFDATPWAIARQEEVSDLMRMLTDPSRQLPVFVLSVADQEGATLVDALSLARAVAGLAHVVVLPQVFTWELSDTWGRSRSVFEGAARVYMPGFTNQARPYEHRLALAEEIRVPGGADRTVRWMRMLAASDSTRRARLGAEVIAFKDLRNAGLRQRQLQLTQRGASEAEQLAAADQRIRELESQAQENAAYFEYFDVATREAEERAVNAETQHRAAVYRIQHLQQLLANQPEHPAEEVALPEEWEVFADWCDTQLAGRVSLAAAARRNVRSPEFLDVQLAARCLLWLATDYRTGRLEGAEGDFREYPVVEGHRNSRCGGDEFEIFWQGRTQTVDWHIKDNAGTRDPRRSLRIYYFWEPETSQVVVADMPAHRRSPLS